MQILELILYGNNGKVRHLPFQAGAVNIISGESGTGKSAVGDIIDYCFGGTSCNIADGVVRENVAWYGLLLKVKHEQIFIARQNPAPGRQSTSYCYYETGKDLQAPQSIDFESNTNVEGLEEFLSQKCGIIENLNIPPEGQSRQALMANIRHALYYCFQNQDEIAARNYLFHKQSEDFITQAIKDTMPYFLGIVDEEALALENEKTILKRKIILEKRSLEEARMLQGGGMKRATSLISEAIAVGLINSTDTVNYNDYYSLANTLNQAAQWSPSGYSDYNMDRLSYLQSQLNQYREQLGELNDSISAARNFLSDSTGFSAEVKHQKVRLSSIGLFEALDFRPSHCPLCSNNIGESDINAKAIQAAILELDANINSVSKERPKLQKYIDNLELKKQTLQETISNCKSEIDGVYKQKQEAQIIKDLNARRAKVVGRISLWLESVELSDGQAQTEDRIRKYEKRLGEIETKLDVDSLEDRKQSILSRISVDMTQWAIELDLEHSKNPYRLDMNKVTVVVDKPDRPVPLKQLGSASNWVGIHLITYLALHKYFRTSNRPVPSFLFLDQPSQVYFPSELDDKNIDWQKVKRLYNFIFEKVASLNGSMQVIIVDHANFKDNKRFQNALLETWGDDKKLVPPEWYQNNT